MFFPLLVTNNFDDVEKSLLERVVSIVKCALNDDLVVAREDFVLFENHRARPRAVVNREVNYPLVGRGRRDVA